MMLALPLMWQKTSPSYRLSVAYFFQYYMIKNEKRNFTASVGNTERVLENREDRSQERDFVNTAMNPRES